MTGYAQATRTELSKRAGWDRRASARSRTTSRTPWLRDVAASLHLVLFDFLFSLVPRQFVNDSYDSTIFLLSLLPRQFVNDPDESEKTFLCPLHARAMYFEILRNLVVKMNPL